MGSSKVRPMASTLMDPRWWGRVICPKIYRHLFFVWPWLRSVGGDFLRKLGQKLYSSKDSHFLGQYWDCRKYIKKDLQDIICKPLFYIVRPRGFEPPTCGTGIRHSIQLSYGRLLIFLVMWFVHDGGWVADSNAVLRFGTGDIHASFRLFSAKFTDHVDAPFPP